MKNQVARIMKTSALCAFVLALSVGVPGNASARFRDGGYSQGDSDCPTHNVPEIDPSTATLAIGVAGGALAILRDRRRRR